MSIIDIFYLNSTDRIVATRACVKPISFIRRECSPRWGRCTGPTLAPHACAGKGLLRWEGRSFALIVVEIMWSSWWKITANGCSS